MTTAHRPAAAAAPSAAPAPRRYLGALDGMRALAAYGVVATHAGFDSGHSLDDGPLAPFIARLDFGVTVFFLLSAVVNVAPFAAAALAGRPLPVARSFWWRRAVRILPAYLLVVVVTLTVISPKVHPVGQWLAYLTLTQTYTGQDVDPYLTQMWTLATELAFYAVLPGLAWLTTRAPARHRVRAQYALVVGLVLVALAADVAGHRVDTLGLTSLLWLPANVDWFALGIVLVVLASTPATTGAGRTVREWAARPGACWLVGVLLYALSTLPLAGPRGLAVTTAWEWSLRHWLYGAAAFAFLLPLVVGTGGRIGSVLASAVPRRLGGWSYGVYLWHLPLLLLLQRALGFGVFRGHFWTLLTLTAVGATLAAAISWQWFERPLLQRFTRRTSVLPGASADGPGPATVGRPPAAR